MLLCETIFREWKKNSAAESIWLGISGSRTVFVVLTQHLLVLMQQNMRPDVMELCSTEDYDPLGFVSKIKV